MDEKKAISAKGAGCGAAPPAPDFRLLFESLPGLVLILLPDAPRFTLVAVSDTYLAATLTQRTILGRGLFEVFPDNPDDPAADGVRNLAASLSRVVESRRVDTMALQKYDVERPDGSGFEEKWWSPINTPVLENGEIRYIIHQVSDVTADVLLKRESARQASLLTALIEAMPSGVLVSDLSGKILVNNPAARAITHLSTEDIPANPANWPGCFGIRTPQGRLLTLDEVPLGRALRGETVNQQQLLIRNERNGEGVHVTAASRPLHDAQGGQIGALVVFTDVSQRAASERALAESEARYKELADNNPCMLIRCTNTPGWPHVYVSKAVEQITGLPVTAFFEQPTLWTSLMLEEDLAGLAKDLEIQLAQGTDVKVEYRIRHQDGSIRWIEGNARLKTLHDGSEIYEGINVDNTARKLVERELAESEARYRQLSDDNPAVLLRCRKELGWPVLQISKAIERISGYLPAEFTDRGLLISDVIFPEDLPGLLVELARQEPLGGDIKLQYRIRHRDGSLRWISSQARALTLSDGSPGYHAALTDVTETKLAELALIESERRYQALADNTPAIIFRCRQAPGWPSLYMSRATESITGYPVKAFIEDGLLFGSLVPDEDVAPLEASIAQQLAKGDVVRTSYRIRHSGGALRWVEVNSRQIRLDDDSLGFEGAITDITEKKLAERLLQDHATALERANAELDDFTYVASHDLKEPLRGIHNYARFLAEDYADNLDEGGQKMLKVVSEQAERMQRLIDDLLHIARLGREPIKKAEVNLDAVVDEVLASLAFSMVEKNVNIQRQPLGVALCSKERMSELYRNLITNAIKYNDKPVPVIEIGRSEADGKTSFSVRDNGIGIKAQFHARVFAPFKRLHAKDAYGGGTGVGLAIVKRIIEAHDGEIRLESEPGLGTTFIFSLSLEHAT